MIPVNIKQLTRPTRTTPPCFTSSAYISIWILLLLSFISSAVNPGCKCIRFTSTYGKQYGAFSSPDYPLSYPRGLSCLLYSFKAPKDYIVHIILDNFNLLSLPSLGSSSSSSISSQNPNGCSNRGGRSGSGGGGGSDYLKLFLHLEEDGVNELTPWNTLLCGKGGNQSFYSSSRHLIIQFHTSGNGNGFTRSSGNNHGIAALALSFVGRFRFLNSSQFEANGRLVPGTRCDYQFLSANYTAAEGRFFSPRYPSTYPHNSKCLYFFHASLHERVKLVFESVSLQPNEASCLNKTDAIRVLDGGSIKSPVISMICNTAADYEILSTGPDLIVEFISNSEEPGLGFKAKFHFVKIQLDNTIGNIRLYQNFQQYDGLNFGPDGLLTQASTLVPQCNQIITSDAGKNGSFTSPNYPHSLTTKTHCRYEFIGHGKERVQIVFMDLSLHHSENEPAKSCEGEDSLTAYVPSPGGLAKLANDFCGVNTPPNLMSNGHKLTIDLNVAAQSSRTSRGFSALYYFVEDFGIKSGKQLSDYPCAFVYNGAEMSNGSFTSPNYGGLYPRSTECHYFFNGNDNEHVEILFTYFHVHGFGACDEKTDSDYVEFSNYMPTDPKYKRMCGSLRDLWVQSDRRFFRVTFRSNSMYDGTGFSANFVFTDKPSNRRVNLLNTPLATAGATPTKTVDAKRWTQSCCYLWILLSFMVCELPQVLPLR